MSGLTQPAKPATEDTKPAAPVRRVVRSQAQIRRVIESLCPGCTRNAMFAASLFAENAARAQGSTGPATSQPAAAEGTRPATAQPSGQLRPPRPQIEQKLIYNTPPTRAQKVWSYTKAKFGGRAPRWMIAARRSACLACERIVQHGDGLFCSACGCGYRRDANLALKTRMKLATCPRGRWPSRRPPGGRLRSRLTGLLNVLRTRFR